MKKLKYILFSTLALGFLACENDTLEDLRNRGQDEPVVLEEFTQGSLDVSNFVSMGNSLTAGFADGALYRVSQENSTPAILAQQFAGLANGGTFTQPLMNDNVGGLLFGGVPNPSFGPRLFFNPVTSGIGPVPGTPSTEVFAPSSGPYNNLGVPGAKSFHLLFDGYGNPGNLPAQLANPYYVRMASAPNATIVGEAIAQQPSFISLWIGNNDVLGYALSGGDGSDPITPMMGPPGVGFQATYETIVGALVTNIPGVQGILANIPNVTAIPHFTSIPYNPIPLDPASADALNGAYAAYNGGLQLAVQNGLLSPEEAERRTIVFAAGEGNAMVMIDEDLTDLSGTIGLPNFRQSTPDDLFVLPLQSLIPQGFGTQIPLNDSLALTPEEQIEINDAIVQFNQVISSVAQANGFALLDANSLLDELASSGIETSGLILSSDLVTGGAFSLDGVHPNSRGYALIANEMLKAIDEVYGSNFEASGNLVDVSSYNTNYSPLLQ